MARTRNTRRRSRTRPARKGQAARRKAARKRAKPAPRRAKRVRRPLGRKRAKLARRSFGRTRAKPVRRAARTRPTPVKARRKTRASTRPRQAAPARRKAVARPRRPNPRPRTLARPPLDRTRRLLADDERLEQAAATAKADRQDDNLTASAHAGHDALRAELRLHTEAGPEMTAGDVDAKWQDAYAVGDEAPGGDNPTPDQDRVDDIGRALGIEYQDGQELQGGEEVLERDKHRWELDPASSDDWADKK